MKYPDALQRLIESFQMFPSIGPKTAERLAFFAFSKMSNDKLVEFSRNLLTVQSDIHYCKNCGVLADSEECEICKDSTRESKLIVVEGSKDVIVFEKTNQYSGKYHVLNGLISPMNGVSPDDINLKKLIERIKKEEITEVVIATSATIEGEMTALYIKNSLEDLDIEVTRIGYGLPAGGDIEYADEITLIKALEGRKKM